ncbi:TonB-dependent receptor [Croceicoccus sediminis]|uniref:TonB-dependent receptor n=1 Tax=Croceicoccus sediminis TaxID=2571150 RepID=UPI001181EC56|nr:TonB-dependent receptor [Croceicoccus sediminis]
MSKLVDVAVNKSGKVRHLRADRLRGDLLRGAGLALGGAIVSMTAAGHASAQTADDGADSMQIEEIVVTAQKRSERLQDVPIAITAFTENRLEAVRVSTNQDIQLLAPSLIFNQVGGSAKPFLRGVGSDLQSPNTDSSVAFYIDGIYQPEINSLMANLLGVERIEVVAGPQGTLYGRNALAGAINLLTLTPKQEFRARASLTVGDYDRREAKLEVSGGVTDTLSVGIYAAGTRRDSYLKRPAIAPSEGFNGKEESWGIRGKFVWEPADIFKLTGSIEHSDISSDDAPSVRNIDLTSLGFVFGNPQILENYVVPASYIDGVVYERGGKKNVNFSETKSTSFTLRADTELGFADLVALGNYRRYRNFNGLDIDGGPLNILRSSAPIPDDTYSGELQLVSKPSSAVKWVAGLYFFHDDAGLAPNLTSSDFLFPAPIKGAVQQAFVRTRNWAAYGETTIPLTDQLSVTAGARYSTENKRLYDAEDYFVDGTNTLIPGTLVEYSDKSKTYNSFTPKVTLSYQDDGMLFYATYSKGYKSGVWNITTPKVPGPVAPEKLTNYEIGSKLDLFDGRVRWNTSAFYYDRTDLQVDKQVIVDGVQLLTLQSAGHAEQYGIETTLEASLSRALTLNASLAWEDSKYISFTDYVGVVKGAIGDDSAIVDVTGNEVQKTPRIVGNLGLNYSKRIDQGGRIKASANLYYNDGFWWTPQNTSRQDSYALINASVGYSSRDDRWSLMAWVTNLTDKHYLDGYFPIGAFGTLVNDAAPRMIGATLTLRAD